jgi:hypothetical protein
MMALLDQMLTDPRRGVLNAVETVCSSEDSVDVITLGDAAP